jgi:hypothetical protein
VSKSQQVQSLGTRIGQWALAAIWAAQPLLSGPAFAAALDPRADRFRTAVSVALWAVWVLTLVAILVPRTSTLTLVRTVVPASVAAAGWAAVATPEPGWRDALALTCTTIAAVVALAPATGERFVNGSAYGPEKRFPLRAPGLVVLGLVEAVWVAVVAGATAGPLLLAAGQWGWGIAAVAAGWPLAYAGARSLHRLAQRWLVFVPAGLALVDPLTLTDSVSMPRARLAAIGPASADTQAEDLTGGALGLALHVRFDEPTVVVPLAAPGQREAASIEVRDILVTPTRPGAVLREAADRRLPIS